MFLVNLRKAIVMRTAQSDKIFTVEEYIKHELTSERRHEFVNGQLFEIPEKKILIMKLQDLFTSCLPLF